MSFWLSRGQGPVLLLRGNCTTLVAYRCRRLLSLIVCVYRALFVSSSSSLLLVLALVVPPSRNEFPVPMRGRLSTPRFRHAFLSTLTKTLRVPRGWMQHFRSSSCPRSVCVYSSHPLQSPLHHPFRYAFDLTSPLGLDRSHRLFLRPLIYRAFPLVGQLGPSPRNTRIGIPLPLASSATCIRPASDSTAKLSQDGNDEVSGTARFLGLERGRGVTLKTVAGWLRGCMPGRLVVVGSDGARGAMTERGVPRLWCPSCLHAFRSSGRNCGQGALEEVYILVGRAESRMTKTEEDAEAGTK